MKKNITLKSIIAIAFLFIASSAVSQTAKKVDKKKFLENRKFKVQFYEIKAAGRGKAVESMVELSSGSIESTLMKEKLQAEEAKFSVILDSTYTEDDTEMRLVKLEAFIEGPKEEIKWEATIINYDIEGTVVQKKGDVEKKKFEFSGTEKTKK